MILFKIAFRNLREHKTKTLIIGSLIALGITILVAGNSIMGTITAGLQDSYRNNYTGDYIIRSVSEEEPELMGMSEGAEAINNYSELGDEVEALASVGQVTPVLSGAASIAVDEETVSFSLLWGIEVESYREMFPDSYVITEGSDLKPEEEGIVLTQSIVDSMYEENGITLEIGDTIVLSGMGSTGTKIREVTVRGIGYFANNTGTLDMISFVDANTIRGLNGLTAVSYEEDAGISEPAADLFGDDMFGGGLVTDTETGASSDAGTAIDFDNILGDTSIRDHYSVLDNDAWYFMLIKVADGYSTTQLGADLDALTAEFGAGEYIVEDWLWGAGNIAEMTYGLQTIFNIIILVISIVAVIIIMNTLVISVTERIPEIGTIRAIGGQKMFVRKMVMLETLMITIVFGIVGILLGGGIIAGLNLVGIQASSMVLQVLFGGSVLNPVLSISSVIYSLLIVGVIGIVSSLYPVSVALGITPVQAMQRQ